MKKQIKKELVYKILMDKCSKADNIIFSGAWCSHTGIVRFTTPFFRKFTSYYEKETGGRWKTGDRIMYEVSCGDKDIRVNCVLNPFEDGEYLSEPVCSLVRTEGFIPEKCHGMLILKSWLFTELNNDVNTIFVQFDELLETLMPAFEYNIAESAENIHITDNLYLEGERESYLLNKYERNLKARAACIAAHGTKCKICGFDFGDVYDKSMSGIIEVHHIVPVSSIGKEYVLDPEKDLIPVCPNCHTALHSKKGNIYTVNELRKMINKQ